MHFEIWNIVLPLTNNDERNVVGLFKLTIVGEFNIAL